MGLPLNVRACIVLVALVVIATAFVYFFNRNKLFIRWGGLWIVITMAAFLSGNIWLFTAIVALICFLGLDHSPSEKLVYYFLLLPAVPSYIFYEIPGLIPGVRFWFNLTYPRMLELFILIPLIFNFYQYGQSKKLFQIPVDKYVISYLVLLFILGFRQAGPTEAFRSGFYLLLDIFIPYFVISRSVNSLEDFKKIFSAIIFSAIILSFVGIFEELKSWLLYSGLDGYLHISCIGGGAYQSRGGFLRVLASMGYPISFGFFLTLAIGVLFYLKNIYLNQRIFYKTTLLFLLLALFLTVSRGPWVGCVIFFIIYIIFQGKKIGKMLMPFLLISVLFPFVMDTSVGQEFYKLLPFVKSEHYATVEYRKSVFEVGMKAIEKRPLFGSIDFLETGELESLRTGNNIIDLVNTYIGIGLQYGLVGTSLFALIFISLIFQLYLIIKNKVTTHNEEYLKLGKILFAIILSIMATIATVSSVSQIPIYYWSFISLSAGYISMLKIYQLSTK